MLTKKKYDGIPADLTLEKAREWVAPRISVKRFKHVTGVAKVAHQLALQADCDPYLAELAGWLHDACKEVKDKELVKLAKAFGMKLTAAEEANGHLLHGPVAAETVKRDLNISNELVLNAMREHTLGAVGMTELSKVVYLADCLEESRPKDYTDPIWSSLHEGTANWSGEKKSSSLPIDMDAAILTACDLGLQNLIETHRAIHPKTIDVRNYYLAVVRKREN